MSQMGHQLPPRALSRAAARPPITDTEARGRRGRMGHEFREQVQRMARLFDHPFQSAVRHSDQRQLESADRNWPLETNFVIARLRLIPDPSRTYALAAFCAASKHRVGASCRFVPHTLDSEVHPSCIHGLKHFFGRSGVALRDAELSNARPPCTRDCKGFHVEIRDSPNCSATSSAVTIEPSSTTRCPDHAGPVKGLRPPRRLFVATMVDFGLLDCRRPVAFRPRRPASRRGSFRRIHLRAQMRLAVSGRENLLQKRQGRDHPKPAGPVRAHRRKRYHPGGAALVSAST